MDEMNVNSPPPVLDAATATDGIACDVVTALDGIFDHLIAIVPAEGVGPDVPLSFAEVRAARSIPAAGSVTMHMLAKSMGAPLSTATHLVDRLVAKGVVVRIRPEYDRRLVLVELSERSKACRQVTFRKRVEVIQRLLEPLTPAAREQVARLLEEIAQAASSHASAMQDNGKTP
jgi:DNA-binding MarR family transcriptional regulator